MTITARYPSTCTRCGGRIRVGESIEWTKGSPARHVACAPLPASVPRPVAAVTPGAYRLGGGSGYGCTGWTVGEVILSGEQRRREGGPDGLLVLTASRRYVREDGLSFGVGDDSGYLYTATARAATREELGPAIERAHESALADERALDVKRLEALFRAEGEYPPPSNGSQIILVGDEVEVSGCEGRIYGGGLWAVIEPDGERAAPAAEEVEVARAERDRLVEAVKIAQAALIAWTSEHLPADAPTRLCNGGRPPYDGQLYSKADLASLGDGRPAYEALLAEVRGLSYTTSPGSYHAAERRLRDLEQAGRLASYPRSIWLVRAHGADGDDWSGNNVRTQGAGGIGRRLPWSVQLEARVRVLREGGR